MAKKKGRSNASREKAPVFYTVLTLASIMIFVLAFRASKSSSPQAIVAINGPKSYCGGMLIHLYVSNQGSEPLTADEVQVTVTGSGGATQTRPCGPPSVTISPKGTDVGCEVISGSPETNTITVIGPRNTVSSPVFCS
jgi:hypothetical protein